MEKKTFAPNARIVLSTQREQTNHEFFKWHMYDRF